MAHLGCDTASQTATTNATVFDHAQMLLSQCSSTIRSQVSNHSRLTPESAAQEVLNVVGDQAEQEAHQASEEVDGSCITPESNTAMTMDTMDEAAPASPSDVAEAVVAMPDGGSWIMPESPAPEENAAESNTAKTMDTMDEAAPAAPSDGAEAELASTHDDFFVEASYMSPTSADGIASVDEATCQQSDARASLLDRAQVFWSQSVSTVRSSVSVHNQAGQDPSVNSEPSTPISTTEVADSVAGTVEEEASQESGTPTEAASAVDTMLTEAMDEAGTAVGSEAEALADEQFLVEASDISLTSENDSVSPDHASVTEATPQQVDANASLADRAQVLWSTSLSAVRSQASVLTQYSEDSMSSTVNARVDAEASASPKEVLSADLMGDQMVEMGASPGCTSLQTLQSWLELEASAVSDKAEETSSLAPLTAIGFDKEDAAATRARDSAAQTVESAASATARVEAAEVAREPVHSVSTDEIMHGSQVHSMSTDEVMQPPAAATPEMDTEQTHVDATRLDHAQVFLSLAVSALRVQVSALSRANSAVIA